MGFSVFSLNNQTIFIQENLTLRLTFEQPGNGAFLSKNSTLRYLSSKAWE